MSDSRASTNTPQAQGDVTESPVNPLGLSGEEISLLRFVSTASDRKFDWGTYWLAQFIPPFLFAAYAIWKQEMAYLVIALVMECGFSAWRIYQKRKSIPKWRTLSEKVLATLEPRASVPVSAASGAQSDG